MQSRHTRARSLKDYSHSGAQVEVQDREAQRSTVAHVPLSARPPCGSVKEALPDGCATKTLVAPNATQEGLTLALWKHKKTPNMLKVLKMWECPAKEQVLHFHLAGIVGALHLPHSYKCKLSHFYDSPHQGNKDCNVWREATPCGFKRGHMRSMFLGVQGSHIPTLILASNL